MRLPAKKPKILKAKIELANLILENWNRVKFYKSKAGYYWAGTFDNNDGLCIDVSFQMYVTRLGVDYVGLYWNQERHPEFNHKHLPKGDIIPLLNRFKKPLTHENRR